MRIPPFHAPVRGVGLQFHWHDHSECFVAHSIEKRYRVPGKSDCPRCPYCALFDGPFLARNQRKPKRFTATARLAEQIHQLQSLLEAEVITQEEYDAQAAKLLR